MKAYPVRMFVGVLFAAVVWFTPMFGSDGDFPLMYYFIIIGVFMLHQVCTCIHTYIRDVFKAHAMIYIHMNMIDTEHSHSSKEQARVSRFDHKGLPSVTYTIICS